MTTGAQRVLDAAYSLPRLEALAAAPETYAEALAADLEALAAGDAGSAGEGLSLAAGDRLSLAAGDRLSLAALEAADAAEVVALAAIDGAAARATKLRLEHALAGDASIGPPTRNVFAQTVVAYAGDLELLARRARDVAARGRAPDPDATAARVVDAARAALDLRAALRAAILGAIAARAAADAPRADALARDRRREDPERRRWSAARRDLEAVAADPSLVTRAPRASRLAALPEQIDDPAPGSEPTFASMIELD